MLSTQPCECPQSLLDRAKAPEPSRTAIVGAGSTTALESARLAHENGLVDPVLLGNALDIANASKAIGWDIGGIELIDCASEKETAARAVELARQGEVGTVMKGHIHTDVFMGAIVNRETGLRTDRRLSHVFHMSVPQSDRVLMITDAAVNIAPDITTKQQIILNAVDMAHALGNSCPRVALLSATEEVNPRMQSSVDAAELSEWANDNVQNALVHGPLAFDNAFSPDAAALKGVDHPVAGNADIVVVPNIETGNALFKNLVYCNSACAAGVVLGAAVPIVLTSRADPPVARLASIAVATILSQSAG